MSWSSAGGSLAAGVPLAAVALGVGDAVGVDVGVCGELAGDGEPVDADETQLDGVDTALHDRGALRLVRGSHGG
jgi:hypothetical protein